MLLYLHYNYTFLPMTFKQKVRERMSKEGRKNQWLADQMQMHRKTLWQKMKDKTLTPDEKNRICEILQIVN